MNSSKIDVAYVAELARLDLTEEEKALFQPQLEGIVKYVEKIASVDVDGVPPTLHGHAIVNALREDEVRPSMAREEALANAPGRTGDEFLLPKIVEGAESGANSGNSASRRRAKDWQRATSRPWISCKRSSTGCATATGKSARI